MSERGREREIARESSLNLPLFFQVSNQCMALVRDDCLIPTLDAPELGYVRESSAQQYVPDVFYKVHISMLHRCRECFN